MYLSGLRIFTCFVMSFFIVEGFSAIQREKVYQALSGDSAELLTEAFDNLSDNQPVHLAYKGALLMRKAAFASTPQQRLEYFNKGREILEKEITKYPDNVELRFLRLMIQENSPRMLGYNTNISNDIVFIEMHYKTAERDLRKEIERYAKKSKILNLSN